MVDFHDAMELILDPANAKDPRQVIVIYPQVSEKLHAVEVEANDAEIQAIRANLDGLLSLVQRGAAEALPAKGGELKSSFVKVYLVRGSCRQHRTQRTPLASHERRSLCAYRRIYEISSPERPRAGHRSAC